jgi:hypothetical protein
VRSIQIMRTVIRAMCGCRKNKGVPAAAAPPPPPPPPRSQPLRARAVRHRQPAPRTVTVPAQQREVVYITRRKHRRTGTIELRSVSRKPLEVLDTAIWGPSVWQILHAAAERLPATAASLGAAISALDGALPCPDCRKHYHTWLQAHPVNDDLRTWLLDLHNDVNVRTGKAPWSADALSATYGGPVDVTAALATLKERIGIDGWRALSVVVAALSVPV